MKPLQTEEAKDRVQWKEDV